MKAAAPFVPAPRRIAVLRALQLGDMLCAVPAIRALRCAYPSARITLIGLPWAREFARRFDHYIDDLIEFPGWPGLPERDVDAEAIPAFLAGARSRAFDVLVQMHGDGRLTNGIAALLGARTIAGACASDAWRPDGALFAPYPEHMPERARTLAAVEPLGVVATRHDLEFPVMGIDRADLSTIYAPSGGLAETVVLHPGARAEGRRWPAVYFSQVGDALAADGFRVVISGSREERVLADEVAASMRRAPVVLAGETTLGALAALVEGAALVVCNDTGVSHLADALRTPSVVLFTGSEPDRWAPHDVALHRVVHHPDTLDPYRVLAHARDLLERRPVYAL